MCMYVCVCMYVLHICMRRNACILACLPAIILFLYVHDLHKFDLELESQWTADKDSTIFIENDTHTATE